MLGPLSALERVPLSTTAPVNEELIESCRLERSSEYRYELPESAVDALTESDVAFHWGIGILSGDVLRPPNTASGVSIRGIFENIEADRPVSGSTSTATSGPA